MMQELVSLLKKASERIKAENSVIQIVTHNDADGIASAAIIASALSHLGKDFQITIVKRIKPEVIEEVQKREPKLVIFTDIGSSYLDEINKMKCDVIIADHHEPEGTLTNNIIHLNPEQFDINLTGAGVTYLLSREILQNNSLAPLAVVGTLGDLAYSASSRIFDNPQIEFERGLNLFGRFSRPLHKAIELSRIPGVGGDTSKAIQFLAEVGIDVQKNGDWRTLNDLTDDEKKRLADAIVREKLIHDDFNKENTFGEVLTLKNFPEELRDAKEFATLLNSVSRMGEPTTGIAICLGSKKALNTAKNLLKGYKRMIANSIDWVKTHSGDIKQGEYASYIIAKDNIHENIIGTIVSILFDESDKPLIGLANAEDGVKISARSKDINIHKVVRAAAESCGGSGGGHATAAGATIPAGTEEKFIERCELLFKENL